MHRAELAKRKENRGEGRSGPALDSILGASGKVDVERAQAVLSAEKTARRGEEAIREKGLSALMSSPFSALAKAGGVRPAAAGE